MENNLCLEVKNLKKYFPVGKTFFGKPNAFLKAVDDVSFTIEKGTTLGLVGESGCGKTTVGRTILRLHEVTGGQVLFKGLDLATVSKRELRRMRPDADHLSGPLFQPQPAYAGRLDHRRSG